MKKIISVSIIVIVLFLLIGNTHRILPASSDDCQTDISHVNHINDLVMFHCIGHTEYMVAPEKEGLLQVAQWDHLHSWMTLEWHIEQGFSKEQALELIAISQQGE